MPPIFVLRRLRQENYKLERNQIRLCSVSLCVWWGTWQNKQKPQTTATTKIKNVLRKHVWRNVFHQLKKKGAFFPPLGGQSIADFKCGKAVWLGHSGHKVRSRAGRKKAQAHFVYRQFALLCSKIMEQKSFAELAVSGSSWRRVININESSRNTRRNKNDLKSSGGL